MLTLTGIGVDHGAGGPPLLHDINLALEAGEVVGIVGSNGAGKSTLARVIAGLEEPARGAIAATTPGLRVGLVLQDPAAQVLAGTVAEDVAFGLEREAVEPRMIGGRVAGSLAVLGIVPIAWADPHRVSGGEQQRVAAAGQLAREPDLLVLDEATAHLDAASARQLVEAMLARARAGCCVVWVTQQLAELARCSRVVVLDAGAIVYDGEPRALLEDPAACGRLGLGVPPAVHLSLMLRSSGCDVGIAMDVDDLRARLVRRSGEQA